MPEEPRRLINQLRQEAKRVAEENGRSRSRSVEEIRYFAGIVYGLEQAAIYAEDLFGEDS